MIVGFQGGSTPNTETKKQTMTFWCVLNVGWLDALGCWGCWDDEIDS